MAVGDASMFCDIDKRNTGEIRVEVNDKGGIPVDDVQVSYSCVGEDCVIGQTKYGVLMTKFPVCAGGTISYIREGYLGRFETIDTALDKADAFSVSLEKAREKKKSS